MSSPEPESFLIHSPWISELEFRVSYHETDGQRRVHHAAYLNYFEQGRVEMLRDVGVSYKDLELAGSMLVVTEMNVRYHHPAEFDDILTLRTKLEKTKKVRLYHHYEILLDDRLLVEANSVIACIDSQGKPKRLPSALLDQLNPQ